MSESGTNREQLKLEYILLRKLAEEMTRRMESLATRINEITATRQILEEIEHIDEGDVLLVPLGAGVYIRTQLASKSTVLITVGANVMLEVAPNEALQLLAIRDEEVKDELNKIKPGYKAMVERLHELEKELRITSE